MIVDCAWDATADPLALDAEPGRLNAIAGIAPIVEGCTGALPAVAEGGPPANCAVIADATLPGSSAVICCWIALITGWASDDAALEAIE